MISIQQAEQGITRFIDSEIMPKLSGWRKVGMGAYIALITRNCSNLISAYKGHPAIAALNIIEGDYIDIDAVYNALLPQMQEQITLEIPVIGSLTLGRADLDKLYSYIRS